MERSDIAVQVVDARNPLLYYTQDIQNYAAEMNPPKPIILIVNKADFLSSYQRKIWADYFISHNIYVVYYSAFFEQERIDAIQKSHEPNPTSVNHDYINDEDLIILIENISDSWLSTSSKDMKSIDVLSSEAECTSDFDEVLDDDNQSGIYSVSDYSEDIEENSSDVSSDIHSLHSLSEDVDPVSTNERKITEINAKPKSELHEKFIRITSKLLNREQLISFLSILPEKFGISPQDKHKGKVCIGMVGYPNVGKSSVINTILGVSKSTHGMYVNVFLRIIIYGDVLGVVRVGVSSTPGKTKHFQTLIVNDDLMLCDCPGLVFPSFMSSTGEMICAGILPINQMRDHMEPASIISSRVPEDILNALYGMKIKRVLDFKDAPERPPTAVEFLSAYCEVKKYITETNRFDEFRGCKEILRDFTNGRILSVCPPPDVDFDINRWLRESESIMMKNERVAERLALIRLKQLECNDIENVESISNKPIENESDLVFDGENFNNYDDESDEEDVNVKAESNQSVEKREHKKLKHWGKKNKKLRNKNPYNEENGLVSFVAYSTNRTCYSSEKSISDHDKIKRHDPRKSYGKPFVRPTFPHINSLDVN